MGSNIRAVEYLYPAKHTRLIDPKGDKQQCHEVLNQHHQQTISEN